MRRSGRRAIVGSVMLVSIRRRSVTTAAPTTRARRSCVACAPWLMRSSAMGKRRVPGVRGAQDRAARIARRADEVSLRMSGFLVRFAPPGVGEVALRVAMDEQGGGRIGGMAKNWQAIARISMDDYDDMGAVADALSSAIERRFGGTTMKEGGVSSLSVLFKGEADVDTVREWSEQWLRDHPRASISGKSKKQIGREVKEALARHSGRGGSVSRREKYDLYDDLGNIVGDDVSAYSESEALRLAGGPGISSARPSRLRGRRGGGR